MDQPGDYKAQAAHDSWSAPRTPEQIARSIASLIVQQDRWADAADLIRVYADSRVQEALAGQRKVRSRLEGVARAMQNRESGAPWELLSSATRAHWMGLAREGVAALKAPETKTVYGGTGNGTWQMQAYLLNAWLDSILNEETGA